MWRMGGIDNDLADSGIFRNILDVRSTCPRVLPSESYTLLLQPTWPSLPSKYIAALLTGSSAMMAEAFHTTVDTGNELLLVIGIKRSERPPDETTSSWATGKLSISIRCW